MSIFARHHITIAGVGTTPMLFVHGFGCDQRMWRFAAPTFCDRYRTILLDQIGAGRSDLSAYDARKYATLQGYADDILAVCAELALTRVIFVGHSVSAMIGILAAAKAPDRFAHLVLIGPSPRYLNDGEYYGGFTPEDINGLLSTLDRNYLGWSRAMAPVIMGNPDRPELAEELTNSFCRTDPVIARAFARVTFLSDNRADLARVGVPSLVLQCSHDIIAPTAVGRYVHQHLRNSQFVQLKATGHCPNLSAPEETTDAIRAFLSRVMVSA